MKLVMFVFAVVFSGLIIYILYFHKPTITVIYKHSSDYSLPPLIPPHSPVSAPEPAYKVTVKCSQEIGGEICRVVKELY
jgi:hypothetical protein